MFKKKSDTGPASTVTVPQAGSAAAPAADAPPPTTETPAATQAETQAAPAPASPTATPATEEPATSEQPATSEKPAKAEKPAKPAKAPKPAKPPKEPKEPKERSGGAASVARVRTLVGRTVWLVLMICAILLALTAFMVALDFNDKNGLVKAIYHLADAVDLGVFDPSNPIKTFRTDGSPDLTKITLLNYGLGAVVYLVVGRVLDRLIRP